MSKLKRRLNFCIVVGLLFCVNAAVAAQTLTITGTVTDNNGETLPGVNIRIQGTSTGVVSTVDGTYSILVSDAQSVLEFSFVGYSTVTAVVGDRRVIDVTLQEGQELEELVVIGYGTVRKSDVTGAVFRVGESTIKEKPVQNALQAIQGKAPGVDITSNLRPGEMGEIRIRGERSITASNEPLYVLDGIPMISGNITDINPNDIASIEILKDASATAIYGSRGANGVVLVTMKSGAKGRVSIDYDGTVTFSNIHSLTDWMNSGERLDWQRQGYLNGGTYSGAYGTAPDPARDFSLFMNGLDYMKRILATAYTLTDNDPSRPVLRAATAEEQARGYAAQVPVYDASKLFDQHWTDLVLRTGVTQNHQLSLSSGTDNSRLYLSLGYLDQNSPMKDQDYSRYTVNLRGDITPKKWLTIGLSANASYGVQNYGMNNGSMNGGAQDSYGQALNLAPYAPAFDENGKLFTPEVGQGQMSYHNVASNITQAWYEVRAYSVLANTFAEVRFTPWLRYRMNFGSQFRARRSGYYYGPEFTNPIGAVNTQQETGQYNLPTHFSWVVENLLYADKTFGVHTFGATLLQSAQKQRSENITIRSLDLTFPSAMFYSLQNNKTGNPYNDWGTNLVESQLMSYMVRLNYGLMNKYLLTVTGRWDGASVLAEGHKWDFFPSAALAWKMEQEEFIKNVDVISQLKLRLGYGVTGNSAVAAYSTGGSIYKNNYSFGKIPAAAYKSNVMPNKDLTWEKTAQVNIGLDFGLLRNRITGTMEVYQAKTDALLLDQTLLVTSGFDKVRANIGKTQNRGIEISISSVNIDRKDFRWVTDVNWSANREKIVELNSGVTRDITNGWFVGQPIRVWFGYEYDRLWQDTPEDERLMELYNKAGTVREVYRAGQTKVVDQQLIEDPTKEGQDGWKTVTLASGEKVTYMDNGFGDISTTTNDDRQIRGTSRPDWVAGLTNTFTYKNFDLSFFIYARVGNMVNGALETYGQRRESSVWSPDNPDAKFYQPLSGVTGLTSHNDTRGLTNGTMVTVRNISLSYTLPQQWIKKLDLNRVQVYGQVLNPFLWGGELVKLGINPDDITNWGTASSGAGATNIGSTNHTMLIRSWVIGLRVGF